MGTTDAIPPKRAEALRRALLAWYSASKRDLPWRKTRDPYAIWLSEVMLQQTRVETVIPYYARFLDTYPTVEALADAPLADVLTMWSGLGYYRRARMLHATAAQVRDEHAGAFPDSADGLRGLRGVGPYTAGAVASIAFGRAAALVDGNVARVLSRLFAIEDDVRAGKGLARIWRHAEALVPADGAGEWNQALMELGATVCVPRDPRCLLCPVQALCDARAQGKERTLPLLKAKAKPQGERRIALVAKRAGSVLLARRPDDGRFGGMWEPPSILDDGARGGEREDDAREASAARLLSELGLRSSDFTGEPRAKLAREGEIVHVLSHRRLEVTVYAGELSPRAKVRAAAGYVAAELVEGAALGGRALTTFARKVLAKARIAV